ncbi:MAG: DUF1015 domain-containing protein [Spirochaetales bacterium]|nr:DUF1015 domain-containing protein [Spirochaetales bacterium]
MINDVQPFRSLHYNPDKIENIGQCLSQPYDVISPEQQELYYQQHEYNIIRLILGKKFKNDNETDNRYTRARDLLSLWKSGDILHKTVRSSFWVYEQEFETPLTGKKKVKGFIGKVRLYDYDEMRILPHEKVLKNPVEDRIKLTEITNTQFEYIWCLYEDMGFRINSILDECEKQSEILNYFEKDYNVQHKLWRLVDPEKCEIIHNIMKESKIYIADGHHRYATMLHIRNEYRKKYPNAGPDAPWEYILMYLVNYKHEGLTILPTHIMLHDLNISDWENAINEIEDHFYVKRYSWDGTNENDIQKKWLSDIKTINPQDHKLGFYAKHKNCYFLLTLKNSNAYSNLIQGNYSLDWKLLDVNIVNYLLLQRILGISEEQLSLNTKIKYITDPYKAVNEVRSGNMEALVILNPTRLEDVIKISENRERMPRKSTYFYPKPVSGLVMYAMDMNQK